MSAPALIQIIMVTQPQIDLTLPSKTSFDVKYEAENSALLHVCPSTRVIPNLM